MLDLNLNALSQIPALLGGVLSLDTDIFRKLHTLPGVTYLAWLILTFAGLSEALGQSVMLFLNRVRPNQFARALLSVGFSLGIGLAFWLASTWAVLNLGFGVSVSWFTLTRTLAFACAPLLFSFLTALPYFGVSVFALLGFWCLLGMATGVQAVTELGAREAFLSAVLGFIVWQVLQRTLGRPVVGLARRLERRAVGTALEHDVRHLYASIQSEKAQLSALLDAEPGGET